LWLFNGVRATPPSAAPSRPSDHPAWRRFPRSSTQPSTTSPDQVVIQRKLGFEFETGWYVDTVKKAVLGKFGKRRPDKPLKKFDPIGPAFDGFTLEADVDPNGRSAVEFVVYPPVEEAAPGEQRLAQVMQNVTRIGYQMERAARGIGNDQEIPDPPPGQLPYFTQDKATGRQTDRPFAIAPDEGAWSEAHG
jgi:hypothetical protein